MMAATPKTMATTTTTTTKNIQTKDDDNDDCYSCPICLEYLSRSEHVVYPLPCQNCDYNFCSDCVENFCKAEKDDFQMASDGSRQVKVTVSCPQCRSKYPIHDLEGTVLLLRKAHRLAGAILKNATNEYNKNTTPELILLSDSELTASQLACKSEFATRNLRKRLEEAHVLYEHACEKGGAQRNSDHDETKAKIIREEAKALWMTLLEQLPVVEDNHFYSDDLDGDGSNCRDSFGSAGSSSSSSSKKPVVDDTLFQGYEEFVNRDEKIFLTDLFTSGDIRSLAQAALIMHGVRRMGMTGKHTAIRKDSEPPMSKHEMQKHVDFIDQMKLSYPLPNHMPGYFLIPAYTRWEGYMTLKDKPWDGSILPPQRSKRVFDQVYGQAYKPPREAHIYPITVATIQGVCGPVGRLGLRKGDVVTHVNDAEWNGSAESLQNYIYECYTNHPEDEISLTVNANPETSTFLRIRREMMQRKARERQKQNQQLRQAKLSKV